jgi:hypothetical protein
MRLVYILASASLVLGLAPLACSSVDDSINMGSDSGGASAGSKAQGGSGIGGDKVAGGSSSGGSSSSGSASGGSASNGGKASGGGMNGGSSSGGSEAVGGEASGGTSSVGGEASGGSAGAPSSTCDQNTDCVACGYPTAPATAQQCYCVTFCDPNPMSKTECSANQAKFEKVCANVHLPCPAIKCVPPPEPVCTNHVCAEK